MKHSTKKKRKQLAANCSIFEWCACSAPVILNLRSDVFFKNFFRFLSKKGTCRSLYTDVFFLYSFQKHRRARENERWRSINPLRLIFDHPRSTTTSGTTHRKTRRPWDEVACATPCNTSRDSGSEYEVQSGKTIL